MVGSPKPGNYPAIHKGERSFFFFFYKQAKAYTERPVIKYDCDTIYRGTPKSDWRAVNLNRIRINMNAKK
jgi:hypothetical protein